MRASLETPMTIIMTLSRVTIINAACNMIIIIIMITIVIVMSTYDD